MEGSENKTPDEMEWQLIIIDNKEYLLNFNYEKDLWKVILTDLVNIWIEELESKTINDRCMRMNPALDIEVFDAKNCITHLFSNILKYSTEINVDHISLSRVIKGGLFKFTIYLKEGSSIQLWKEVTSKLCQSILVLNRKNQMLIEIIKNKDREILEYRLEQAKLVRKNIETEMFEEKSFNNLEVNAISSISTVQNIQSLLNISKLLKFKQDTKQEGFIINSHENLNVNQQVAEVIKDESSQKLFENDQIDDQFKINHKLSQSTSSENITKRMKTEDD